MSKNKLLFFMSFLLAVSVFAYSSGDALAQGKQGKGGKDAVREAVLKDVAAKGKATSDDAARYFGKVTPSEQKAAAKRARQLGLLPGIAGLAVQTPPPGGTR